jgi:hypothetical protein
MTNAQAIDPRRDAPIYQTSLHWIVLVGPSIIGIGLIGIGAGLVVLSNRPTHVWEHRTIESGWLGIAIMIIGIISIGSAVLLRESTELTVTSARVTASTGVLGRRLIEILMPQVESIQVDQTALGRLLDFGTVTLRGTGGTPETLMQVAHATEFRRHVEDQLSGRAPT